VRALASARVVLSHCVFLLVDVLESLHFILWIGVSTISGCLDHLWRGYHEKCVWSHYEREPWIHVLLLVFVCVLPDHYSLENKWFGNFVGH
jgi:hypothetical protein